MTTDSDEARYCPIPRGTLRIVFGLVAFSFWSFGAFYRYFPDIRNAVGIDAIGNAIVGVFLIGFGYMWLVGSVCTGHHDFMPPKISRELARFKVWHYFPEWWHRNVIGYSMVYGISHGDENYHNDTLLQKAIPNRPNDKNQNFLWNIPCDGAWRVGTFFVVPLGGWHAKCRIAAMDSGGNFRFVRTLRIKKATKSRLPPVLPSLAFANQRGPVLELSDGDTTLKDTALDLLFWMNFTSLPHAPSTFLEAWTLADILSHYSPCQYYKMKDAADEYRGKLNQERGLLGQEKHLAHELTGIIMRAILAIRESKRFGVHSKEARDIRIRMTEELHEVMVRHDREEPTVKQMFQGVQTEKSGRPRMSYTNGMSTPIDTSTSDLGRFDFSLLEGLRKK